VVSILAQRRAGEVQIIVANGTALDAMKAYRADHPESVISLAAVQSPTRLLQ